MGSRGRKSGVQLSVVPPSPRRLPEPPAGLSPEGAALWRETASALPDGWLGGATPELLSLYVHHCLTARLLGEMMGAFDMERMRTDTGLRHLDRLSRMHVRETEAAARLARTLRLSNQSRFRPTVAVPPQGRKPWEFGCDD